jgi:hypothetical protein
MLLCELPSTGRNHEYIIHILEGLQTPSCHDALDFTDQSYFDELYGCTRVIWGGIAQRRLPVQDEGDKAKGFVS